MPWQQLIFDSSREQAPALDALAEALLERETLDADEIWAIVATAGGAGEARPF